MLLIFWYILLPIFLRINASSIKRKPGNMDDFIAELMASEKFEQLTDTIVNKAVKKIRNIEQSELYQEKVKNGGKNVTILRHHNSDFEREKNRKKSMKLRPDNKNENKTILKKENKSIKLGKIDARTLLNDVPTEELLLSFKHLIEEQKRQHTEKKVSSQKDENDNDRYYASDSADEVSDGKNHKNKDVTKREMSNKIGKSIGVHDYRDSSYASDVDDKRYEEKRDKGKIYQDRREQKIREDRKNSESFEKQNKNRKKEYTIDDKSTEVTKKSLKTKDKIPEENKFSKEIERTDKLIPEENKFSKEIESKDKIPEENKFSKEILEVNIDNNESGNKRSMVELEDSLSTKNNKRKYREENGKLYTYNSSPEYNDYHEKLAREERKLRLDPL